jgi:tetratricopeptide (TPR) repeat protein
MFLMNAERRRSFAIASLLLSTAALPTFAQDIKRGSTETVRPSSRSVGRARAIQVVLKSETPIKAAVVESSGISKAARQHFVLANEFYEKKNFDQALAEYSAAVKASSKFADAWYGLGLVNKAKLDLDSATRAWKNALKVDPGIYQAHAELANAYMAQGEFEDAVSEYKALTEAKPNYAEAYFGLGTVLYQLQRFDEAIPNFEKSIVLKGGFFPEAKFNLAMIYFNKKDDGKAAEYAQLAINEFGADSPDSADLYFTLGTVLYNKSDYDGSIKAFTKTLDLCAGCLSDDRARVFYNLSLSYEVMGQKEQAAAALEQALKLAPSILDVSEAKKRLARLRG